MNKFLDKNYYLIFFVFYLTIIGGFYFNEDSLGGAKHDYMYHLKFINLFKENNITNGLKMFTGSGYEARNSPFFYLIYAFLNDYLSLETLRKLNSIISFLIAIFFFKCLKIKYKSERKLILSLVSCIIFISPTVRSLSIWPYPLLWGILFFIISILYYLKFLEKKNNNYQFRYSIYSTLFLILSAYLHPPLAFFNVFYLFSFYRYLDISKFLIIILINILFIIPIVIFLTEHGLLFFHKVEGENVNLLTTLNIFNKIVIISTIILYYIFPIINPIELIKKIINKINYKNIILFTLITFLFSLFFNYEFTKIHGGGFVHKFSYLVFGNNIFLFFVFFLSIIFFYFLFDGNKVNYIIYILIILTNIQYTIYNKYYDILVMIIFLLISKINFNEKFFKIKNSILYFYSIYFFYYLITVFKLKIYELI